MALELLYKKASGGFMKNSKQLLTAIFVVGAAAIITGCGSSNSTSGSSTLSSSSVTGDKATASCNQASSSSMTAKLKTYTNSSNSVDMSYVWVRMTTLPSGFSTSSSYIAFYKWLGNSSGSTYLDPTKLGFILRDSSTGKYLTSSWATTMTWSDVSATAQSLGIYDAQTFFNRVDILVYLNDSAGQYDVLKIASYTASSAALDLQLDALLPPFSANPTAYATESDGSVRNSSLQALHPFKSLMSQGWTTAQYLSMAQAYCF